MTHAHRCHTCQFVFAHDESAYDNHAAHICPRCHDVEPCWEIYDSVRSERRRVALVLLAVWIVVLCALIARALYRANLL